MEYFSSCDYMTMDVYPSFCGSRGNEQPECLRTAWKLQMMVKYWKYLESYDRKLKKKQGTDLGKEEGLEGYIMKTNMIQS